MKRIIFLLFVILTVISCNAQDYIEYRKGSVPIIITAGHGGDVDIKEEKRAGLTTTDSRTDDLARLLAEKLDAYLVLNKLERSVLDPNRPRQEAYVGNVGFTNYNIYHGYLEDIITELDTQVLLIDIHGASIDQIQLGYDIPESTIKVPRRLYSYKNASFSKFALSQNKLPELVYGENSLGTMLAISGYEVYPSRRNRGSADRYFNGGFTIEKYKKNCKVTAIQIEFPYKGFRDNNENIIKVVKTLSTVLPFYYYKNLTRHEKSNN